MKKLATYLALLSSIINVGVALLIGYTTQFMAQLYGDLLEGAVLPVLTQRVILVFWWPYIFVGIGLICTAISVFTSVKSNTVSHCLTGLLIFEIITLTFTMFGLFLPLYTPMCSMSP